MAVCAPKEFPLSKKRGNAIIRTDKAMTETKAGRNSRFSEGQYGVSAPVIVRTFPPAAADPKAYAQ